MHISQCGTLVFCHWMFVTQRVKSASNAPSVASSASRADANNVYACAWTPSHCHYCMTWLGYHHKHSYDGNVIQYYFVRACYDGGETLHA